MTARILIGVAALVAISLAIWAGFAVAMRTKFRPVLDAVRLMNKRLVNPRMLREAGQPGAYASVIRHQGRSSGTEYETPVQAVPTRDGFVIALPYGPSSDWVRNVLAAGGAVIIREGQEHTVALPQLTEDRAMNRLFPPKDQRSHRWYDVHQFLMVRRSGSPTDHAAAH